MQIFFSHNYFVHNLLGYYGIVFFTHNINIHVAYLLIFVSSLLIFMPLSKSYKFDYPHTLAVVCFLFFIFLINFVM
jgi:hypothetical protein